MTEDIVISLATFLITVFVSYGTIKAKSDLFEKRCDLMEERIYQMRESFVTMAQFNSAIQTMRQDHNDLRQDVKEILSLLTKHG